MNIPITDYIITSDYEFTNDFLSKFESSFSNPEVTAIKGCSLDVDVHTDPD